MQASPACVCLLVCAPERHAPACPCSHRLPCPALAAPCAVGILGLQRAGAEELLADAGAVAGDVAYKAMGRPASPAERLAALHALASVAGAERSGRSGKLLSPDAEAALRVAVFEGGCSLTRA